MKQMTHKHSFVKQQPKLGQQPMFWSECEREYRFYQSNMVREGCNE